MEWLQTLVNRFTEAFKWFWILQPWEQALRVRAGKKIVKYKGGFHFKIPYLDYIFKQNCRMRLSSVPSQTITTRHGKTVTVSGALAYRVEDVYPLYQQLHMAEDTLSRKAQGIVSRYLGELKDICTAEELTAHVNDELSFEKYGLADVEFLLKDFAIVKTYRFITGDMDSTWMANTLQTDEADET